MVWFQSKFRRLRTRKANDVHINPKASKLKIQEQLIFHLESEGKKIPMSQLKVVKQDKFPLTQPFGSIYVFNWLSGSHPHYGGQSAFLSLHVQTLISSRNTFADILKVIFDPTSGYSVVQLCWHLKLIITASFSFLLFSPALYCYLFAEIFLNSIFATSFECFNICYNIFKFQKLSYFLNLFLLL